MTSNIQDLEVQNLLFYFLSGKIQLSEQYRITVLVHHLGKESYWTPSAPWPLNIHLDIKSFDSSSKCPFYLSPSLQYHYPRFIYYRWSSIPNVSPVY